MTITSSLIISTTGFVVICISSTYACLILLHHLLVSLSNILKPSNENLMVTWFIPTSKMTMMTITMMMTMAMVMAMAMAMEMAIAIAMAMTIAIAMAMAMTMTMTIAM